MYTISDYGTEFMTTSISKGIFYHGFDILAIMSKVGSLGSTTDIHLIADDTITDIRKMRYAWVLSYIGIFYLYESTYFRILTDASRSSDICIRSYDASFSEIDISFDIGSWFEEDSLFEIDVSFYGNIIFYRCSVISCLVIRSDYLFVCFEEIPGISYRSPSPMSFYDRVDTFFYIDVDKICNLELTTWREGECSEFLEYGVIELMVSDIGEIPESRISRFFYDTCCFSGFIDGEYPEVFWGIDSLAESSISCELHKIQDITTIIEIITWDDHEFSGELPFEREYRRPSSVYLDLVDVV